MKKLERLKGNSFLLVSYLIWGTSAVMVKFFPRVDSLTLVWARSTVSAVLIGIGLWIVKRGEFKLSAVKQHLLLTVLITLCYIGTIGFMTAGVKYGTVTSTIFLLYTAPIFVTVFSRLFLKEKIFTKDQLAIVIASIALVFMFSRVLSKQVVAGDVFGLLGGLAWGLQIILSRKIGQKVSGETTSFSIMVVASILLLPFVHFAQIATSNLTLLIVYGAVHSGIAALCFYGGIRKVTAKSAGIFSLIDPIENSTIAFLFLHEIPTLGTLLGCVFILLSMVVQAMEGPGKKG